MEFKFFIGIDVSKEKLDVAVYAHPEWICNITIPNTRNEVKKLLRQLHKTSGADVSQSLFCLEHTGMYAKPLLSVLNEHACTIWLETARQIKNSLGMQRGKNDQVDAKRIAEYAYRFKDKLTSWQPPAQSLLQLRELLAIRNRLIKAKKQLSVALEESRKFMEQILFKIHQRASQGPIKALQKSIEDVERQIKEVLHSEDSLKRLYLLVKSVDGVGMIIASHIIVITNGFTQINNPRTFASYCGVAPFEHTSGSSVRGKNRVSHLANKTMKTLLHMAAVSSIKQGGELAHYYHRKVDEGKHKMTIINAMRNKIVHRIFAVVNRGTAYEKKFTPLLV